MAQSTELDGERPIGGLSTTATDGMASDAAAEGKASDAEYPSGSTDEPLRRFLPRVYRVSAVLTVVGTIVARVAGADLLAVNFFTGSMIGLLMLYVTAWMVRRYMTPGAHIKRNRNRLFLLLMAKLPLLGIVLYFVTSGNWFQPIGFLMGVSMTPFTMTLCGLILITRRSSGDERPGWNAVQDKTKRPYR